MKARMIQTLCVCAVTIGMLGTATSRSAGNSEVVIAAGAPAAVETSVDETVADTEISDEDTLVALTAGVQIFSPINLDDADLAAESLTDVSEYTETEATDAELPEEDNEYANLAIANVSHYVNVRSGASTSDEVVGKIYGGAVAQVLETVEGEDGEWFRIVSGDVEGYIKAEYFWYGAEAAAMIDDYVTDTGEFTYAKSLEEEAAEIAAQQELAAAETVSETETTEEVTVTAAAPSGSYEDAGELRSSIVAYAMQFLGNQYVHGGQTLEGGTDCSGFTSLIYAAFGYSISRTPSGQLSSDGTSVSIDQMQPGDIICYGSGGTCTHVALYIGDGQIIHSANPRKGVVIYSYDYDTILGVKNIIG